MLQSPSRGAACPPLRMTTLANRLGSSGCWKNSTVPFSWRMWNKLSTLAKGYFFTSSAVSKSGSPISDWIRSVTMLPAPARWMEWICPSALMMEASVEPAPMSRMARGLLVPGW